MPPGSASVTVTATDSAGHPLTYSWAAVCPEELGSNGSFSPNAAARSPLWTPPANFTRSQQTCTLTVLIDDQWGQTATAGYAQRVDPTSTRELRDAARRHAEPVASGGNVAATALASDSYGHALTYLWSATCPGLGSGGTFDRPRRGEPDVDGPGQPDRRHAACALTVTARDGQGTTATASYEQRVFVLPHTLTITAAPAGSPNPVESSGAVAVTVSATRLLRSSAHLRVERHLPVDGDWPGDVCPGPQRGDADVARAPEQDRRHGVLHAAGRGAGQRR